MKARQAKSSNEVLMVELDQLRYERSQAAASAEAMRRDMSQMQHDLHIGQELNAQLQSDLAATRDDQVWGGGEELELSRWWVLFVGLAVDGVSMGCLPGHGSTRIHYRCCRSIH